MLMETVRQTGVIYVDLLKNGTISSAKDYYIINESYDGDFGEKPVLQAKGNGESRFYIMALEDFNSGRNYAWYGAVAGDGIRIDGVEVDFSADTSGTSLTVMQNMIVAWKAEKYGKQDAGDVWGAIETEVSNGWFIPNDVEWSRFENALGFSTDDYSDFGLSVQYLTCTSNGYGILNYCCWYGGSMTCGAGSGAYVRLSKIY